MASKKGDEKYEERRKKNYDAVVRCRKRKLEENAKLKKKREKLKYKNCKLIGKIRGLISFKNTLKELLLKQNEIMGGSLTEDQLKFLREDTLNDNELEKTIPEIKINSDSSELESDSPDESPF